MGSTNLSSIHTVAIETGIQIKQVYVFSNVPRNIYIYNYMYEVLCTHTSRKKSSQFTWKKHVIILSQRRGFSVIKRTRYKKQGKKPLMLT